MRSLNKVPLKELKGSAPDIHNLRQVHVFHGLELNLVLEAVSLFSARYFVARPLAHASGRRLDGDSRHLVEC
jgi:hypothetical protein